MQLWIIHATHLFSKINIFHSLNLISVYWINSNNNVVYLFQLKDEILSSYQQIKTLCSQLRQRPRRNSNDSVETSSSSEKVIHSDSLKKGALNSPTFWANLNAWLLPTNSKIQPSCWCCVGVSDGVGCIKSWFLGNKVYQ